MNSNSQLRETGKWYFRQREQHERIQRCTKSMGSLGNGTSSPSEIAQRNVSSKESQDTVLAGVQLLKELYTMIRSLNTKSKEDWFYKHDISSRFLILFQNSYGISCYSVIDRYFLFKEFTQHLSKIAIPGISAVVYNLVSHTVCMLQSNLWASQSKDATHGTGSKAET